MYYIWQATSEENQNGTYHKSKPYEKLAQAQKDYKLIKNDFKSLEKTWEFFEHYDWHNEKEETIECQ